jgi:hypothetical protein
VIESDFDVEHALGFAVAKLECRLGLRNRERYVVKTPQDIFGSRHVAVDRGIAAQFRESGRPHVAEGIGLVHASVEIVVAGAVEAVNAIPVIDEIASGATIEPHRVVEDSEVHVRIVEKSQHAHGVWRALGQGEAVGAGIELGAAAGEEDQGEGDK